MRQYSQVKKVIKTVQEKKAFILYFHHTSEEIKKKMISLYLVFSLLVAGCLSQRPSYAGTRPIGYPAVEVTTEALTSVSLDSKLGSGITTTKTTERLPLEALGDRRLVETLLKQPLDKQPFWLINWKKLEENRTKPKTYPLKQNSYLHHIATSFLQPVQFPYFPRFV